MLRYAIRRYSVGPVIKDVAQLKQLMATPTWSVAELIDVQQDSNEEIDSQTIDKVIKLAALNTHLLSESQKQVISDGLNAHMAFAKHLYDASAEVSTKEESNDFHFRLLESDHKPTEPLTLKTLRKQIEALEPGAHKGEIGFKADKPFFTIKK